MVRGAVLTRPTRSSGERRTHRWGGGLRVAKLAFWAHLWSPDRDGLGPLRCSGSDLDFIGNPYPGLSADLPCHLIEIEGLRWQGGSLESGCLAHREIAGYRLFHRGHSLIAIFTHPFNVSITSMLKPMNVRKIAFFSILLNLSMEIRKKRKTHSSWGFMAKKNNIYIYIVDAP